MKTPKNLENPEIFLNSKTKKSSKSKSFKTYFSASVIGILAVMAPKKLDNIHLQVSFQDAPENNQKKFNKHNNVMFNEDFWGIIQKNIAMEADFSSKNTEKILEDEFENSPENQKIFRDFAANLRNLSSNKHFESTLIMIFEQESHFDNNEKSDTGAIGVAQLTGDVFDDMKPSHRWIRYHRLIQFVKQNDAEIFQFFPENLQIEINNLPLYVTQEQWENLRKKFYEHRKNPFVNMFLGAMTLSVKHENIKDESVIELEKNFLENWEKIGVHTEWVKENFDKQDFSQKRMIFAAQKYNGNDMERNFYFHNDPEFDCWADRSGCQSVRANERDIYIFKLLQKISKNNL